MVRSFQVSAVFPNLTVLENVRVALQRPLGTSFHFWKSDATLAGAARARRWSCSRRSTWPTTRDAVAVELPYGRKRALELATTLALDPELLLLDEPTQGMGHEDVGRVVELIRRVAAERTVLMVEHNLLGGGRPVPHHHRPAAGHHPGRGAPTPRSPTNPRVLEAYIGVPE